MKNEKIKKLSCSNEKCKLKATYECEECYELFCAWCARKYSHECPHCWSEPPALVKIENENKEC